jgi:outer membrane protein insertion porin family
MSRVNALTLALLAAAVPGLAHAQAVAVPCAIPDSVAVSGISRIPLATVKADAGIKAGDTLNYRVVQRSIKNLYATGNYDDVQVRCDVNPITGKTTLLVHLVERPLLAGVTVTGVTIISPSDAKGKIELPIGRPVDPALVARAVERIDSAYRAKGFYLAKVKVDSSVTDGRLKLVFAINEGNRLAIQSIQFVGNKKIKTSTIMATLETQPEGFFWFQKGELDEDKLAEDIGTHLQKLYRDRGYIDFQVLSDTVIVDPVTGKGIIVVTVSEGHKYMVGNFEIIGNRHFSTEEIRAYYPFTGEGPSITARVLSVVKGELPDPLAFNEGSWDGATNHVRQMYSNEGYIYAQVRPVVDRAYGKDSVHVVNLRWEIDERIPATINRIDIAGNDYTNESCIREQLVILPGDVFNQDRLLRSYQNIQNMGFFESPLPPPDTRPANEQGDVDIIFKVKEKKTGTINFGASVGQGTGVGGFIGLDQPNLFGTCKRGSLQWRFGRYNNDFQLSYTDPSFHYTRVSATISAYHTRTQYIVADLGRSVRTGGSLQFGFPVRGMPYTRFFISYGAEAVQFSGGVAVVDTSVNTSKNFRSTVGLSLTHDNRVDMPFASAGSLRTVGLQFNGGPLGGTAQFQRLTGEIRNYNTLLTIGGATPGSQPMKLILGLTGRSGMVFGNTGPFFYSQLFTMGGTQYGEMLRGYPSFSITPRGYAPASAQQAQVASFGGAFFSMTAEVGMRFSSMVYMNVFYDAGNVYALPRDFDPTRLFRGAGVGIAIVTPLGPLGLDYGYGFDRIDALGQNHPQWQLHFRLGNIVQ